jgi:hypothetical protein
MFQTFSQTNGFEPSPLSLPHTKKPAKCGSFLYMAERVGFEPTLGLTLNTLSRRAPSATQPPLQIFYFSLRYQLAFKLNIRRTHRARYSRRPAFRPSGHASHVLICSRQISQPLSHLSKFFTFHLDINLLSSLISGALIVRVTSGVLPFALRAMLKV